MSENLKKIGRKALLHTSTYNFRKLIIYANRSIEIELQSATARRSTIPFAQILFHFISFCSSFFVFNFCSFSQLILFQFSGSLLDIYIRIFTPFSINSGVILQFQPMRNSNTHIRLQNICREKSIYFVSIVVTE